MGSRCLLRSVHKLPSSGRERVSAAQTHLLPLISLASFLIKPINRSLILPLPCPWLLSQSRTQQGSHSLLNLLAHQVCISLDVQPHIPSVFQTQSPVALPELYPASPFPAYSLPSISQRRRCSPRGLPPPPSLPWSRDSPVSFTRSVRSVLPSASPSLSSTALHPTLPTPAASSSSPTPRPSSPAPAPLPVFRPQPSLTFASCPPPGCQLSD